MLFRCLVANKACILYVPDLEEYEKNERSLYFKFDELPFEKILDEDKLIKTIVLEELDFLKKDYASFSKKIGLCEDGLSSKKICNLIERVVCNEKI